MVPQKQVLPRPLQLSRGVLIPFFEAAQRGPKIKLSFNFWTFFEATQRSPKIKLSLNFWIWSEVGTQGL